MLERNGSDGGEPYNFNPIWKSVLNETQCNSVSSGNFVAFGVPCRCSKWLESRQKVNTLLCIV